MALSSDLKDLTFGQFFVEYDVGLESWKEINIYEINMFNSCDNNFEPQMALHKVWIVVFRMNF